MAERESVHVILARIDTKLTMVVGEDGNGGRLQEHAEAIADLQQKAWKQSGFFAAIGMLCGAVGNYLAGHWRH